MVNPTKNINQTSSLESMGGSLDAMKTSLVPFYPYAPQNVSKNNCPDPYDGFPNFPGAPALKDLSDIA